MNTNIKSERYRKLSKASLVTGILAMISVPVMLRVWIIVIKTSGFYNYTLLMNVFSLSIVFWFVLPVTAIVCGSVDIRRIKAGRYSNKGRGFDITGIVSGSIILIFGIFDLFILWGLSVAY